MSQYNIFGYKRPSTAGSAMNAPSRIVRSKLRPENSNLSMEKQMQRPQSTQAISRQESINQQNGSKLKSLNALLMTQQPQIKAQNPSEHNQSASLQIPRPYTSNEASFVKQEMQMCRARNQLSSEIDKNQEYFNHLKGKCLCTMCTCGHCKCPFGYIKEQSSLIKKPILNQMTQYQSEFHKFPKETKNLSFNPTQAHPSIKLFSPTQLDKQNYSSIYVTSYQRPESSKTNPVWPNHKSSYGADPQFVSQTQYQVFFQFNITQRMLLKIGKTTLKKKTNTISKKPLLISHFKENQFISMRSNHIQHKEIVVT